MGRTNVFRVIFGIGNDLGAADIFKIFAPLKTTLVHIDYLCLFEGYTFLIMVDAYSRFPVVKVVSSMSARTLIKHTKETFVDF